MGTEACNTTKGRRDATMDQHHATYLSRLLSGDFDACGAIAVDLLDSGTSIRGLYEDLFAPSLHEVGRLWETNQISVAKEHLATAVTERLMAQVAPRIFAGHHVDRSAVVCCTTNEIHQVGGRMVADILELSRWHAYFLGANTPIEDLLALIEEKNPDLLALSVALPSNLVNLEEAIEAVRSARPDLPIILGGQAFQHGGRDLPDRYPGTILMDSLAELESYVLGR